MNTVDLSREVAKAANIKISHAENYIRLIFAKITEAMAKGEVVRVYNFGNLSYSSRPARKGRNPQTGETIDIPAMKSARWSVAAIVKDILNDKEKPSALYDGIDLASPGTVKTVKPAKKAKTVTTTKTVATPTKIDNVGSAGVTNKASGCTTPPPPPPPPSIDEL